MSLYATRRGERPRSLTVPCHAAAVQWQPAVVVGRVTMTRRPGRSDGRRGQRHAPAGFGGPSPSERATDRAGEWY